MLLSSLLLLLLLLFCTGAIYLHDCSIEDKIPIFLIVGALAPILFGGFGKKNDDENEGFGVGTICGIIGFLFNIAWLIAGTLFILHCILQSYLLV